MSNVSILIGLSMIADNLYEIGNGRPALYSAVHFKELIETEKEKENDQAG